ncbi:MAG: hypothetical protein IJZ53_11120 [Tyzzerella sp.]|nr:hypothetical protein [Tyzzerella sp.]
MGGRGASSGKKGASGGVGGSTSFSGAKMGGGGALSSGVGSVTKQYTPSKTPISKMSDKKLKEELTKAAGHYYASGKSGISFGGRDPYQVASTLANQKMSRSRMEKEYKSIMKRLKN